jgi:sirohydrochlorin cobaltochelatase
MLAMMTSAPTPKPAALPQASAIILFAHGSSDPAWAAPFEKIRARVTAQTTETVELAYLERMSPSMDEAVAKLTKQGIAHITVIPLFLAVGGHMRNDLPMIVKEIEQKYAVNITVKQTIGESAEMIAVLADWSIAEARKP